MTTTDAGNAADTTIEALPHQRHQLDDRDRELITHRLALLNTVPWPREGDFITFGRGMGVTQRVCMLLWPPNPEQLQTTRGGSWYLGSEHCSFSGSLDEPIPTATLTNTGRTRPGRAWIFHHDMHEAGGGVDFRIPFRVYTSHLPRPYRGGPLFEVGRIEPSDGVVALFDTLQHDRRGLVLSLPRFRVLVEAHQCGQWEKLPDKGVANLVAVAQGSPITTTFSIDGQIVELTTAGDRSATIVCLQGEDR